jgi:hypothetical protein
MEAPQITVSDKKGGGGIIASVLDALGIHKQVAKEPKSEAPAAPAAPTGTTQSVLPAAPANLPALDSAESAFQPIQPMPSDWGQRYLDSLKPLKTIDPNSAF